VYAAAIFGPGASSKNLKPFQNSDVTWLTTVPENANQVDAILIFGGDGTVHRYLRQLVELQLPVLIVPCGSGNDFANALKLRGFRIALTAWHKFCSGGGNVRTVDLGVIAPLITNRQDTAESPAPRYFCCVGGVGLDAEVARRANLLPRWLRARGGYAFSLLPELWKFAPGAMTISRPGAANPQALSSQKTSTMVTAFANAPSYGGGMKIAPRAQLDDGLLDVCLIGQMNKFKLFCLFPTVYFGRHLNVPQVEYFQTEHARLETEQPHDVYADGEYVCRTPIEVSIARRALRVIVP
jgi:diacylglycerol kinase (ATP)